MFIRLLRWLWERRERPAFGSKPWGKAWAKRLRTLPRLMGSSSQLARFHRQGAQIELPAFVSPCVCNGKLKNLEIGRGSFVGRVEIHLHDRVRIGRNVIINDGVRLLTASHDVNDPSFRMVKGPITIGDHAWVAMGAILLPGVTVGRGAVVGAGALVTKDVPDYAIAVGNPAHILAKSRSRDLRYQPLRQLATIEAWLGPEMKPECAIVGAPCTASNR